MQRTQVKFLLVLISALIAGCGDSSDAVKPEQRMTPVVFASEDASAIQAPRFQAFRAAVIRVRVAESNRPVAANGQPPSSEAIAESALAIETASIDAIAIVRQEGWNDEERRLMQRTLQGAAITDLE